MPTQPEKPGPLDAARITRHEMSPRSGCLSKLPPCDLDELLNASFELAGGTSSRRLGGSPPRHEDSALVEIGQQQLLVTTDIGPIVGIDLYAAGRIAALHAMSDIFACGGIPHWALATLFVDAAKPAVDMATVLAGVLQACHHEGVELVGGHTSLGSEAMAGLTVLGIPRPGVILRKNGALPGDVLFLSKPLGSGLVLRAFKLGLIGEGELADAISIMETSNARASACAVDARVHASTDVTGFGLLGHLVEMLNGNLGASLQLGAIPVLDYVRSLPEEVGRTCFAQGNLEYVISSQKLDGSTEFKRLVPLLDPQTNGGLLVAAAQEAAELLCGSQFSRIGQVTMSGHIELHH